MTEYSPKCVLLSGCAGFIGSNLVNYLVVKYPQITWLNLDRLDYCSSLKNITVSDKPNYVFIKGDIGSMDLVMHILTSYKVDAVMNLAAQSSVDHSQNNAKQHIIDNVLGVQNILEAARHYSKLTKIIQISTDETYGDQESGEPAHEASLLMPNNIYASSKGSADLICRAYRVSYKLPLLITKSNNIYGPRQFIDKVWPAFAMSLLRGEKVKVHGKGLTSRSFLHVMDKCRALETILFKGVIGETYNIGTDRELTVLEVADELRKRICPEKKLDEIVEYVNDRPYNDSRYKISSDKLRALGWKEEVDFEKGVDELVTWYGVHGATQWA